MNNSHSLPVSELLETLTKGISDEDLIYTTVLSDVSNAIIRERIRRNMTQSEFAALLGVTQAQVSKWENEDVNFSLRKLSEISAKLNLRLSCTLTPRSTSSRHIVHHSRDNITYLSVYGQSDESWKSRSPHTAETYEQVRKEM